MSRVSKKKLLKILKGEYEYNDSLTMNKQQIFDMFKKGQRGGRDTPIGKLKRSRIQIRN